MLSFFYQVFETVKNWLGSIYGLFQGFFVVCESLPFPLGEFMTFALVLGLVILCVLLVGKILNALKVW